MPTFVCTVQPCNAIKHGSKGMCHRHYKRTRPRTPDKPKILECVNCGKLVERYAGGYTRKIGATCSDECRHALQWGMRSDLPEDHWARWFGRTSPVYIKRCDSCEAPFASPSDAALTCSKKCRGRRHDSGRYARLSGAEGTHTWAQVTRLWHLFGNACAYCSTPTPRSLIQVEHVLALSRGGRNDIQNLLPSCGPCNADKRAVLLHEWNTDRARRGLPPRTTTWHSSDPRYQHLNIDLLSPQVAA